MVIGQLVEFGKGVWSLWSSATSICGFFNCRVNRASYLHMYVQ